MKLNAIIAESRKKNEKYDLIDLNEFPEKQFFGALNLKASKEGTGFAGSFQNRLFEMCRNAGLSLIEARRLGNLMQQEALDSKHDGQGSMYDSIWFQISQLLNSRENETELRQRISDILNEKPVQNMTINNDLESQIL